MVFRLYVSLNDDEDLRPIKTSDLSNYLCETFITIFISAFIRFLILMYP